MNPQVAIQQESIGHAKWLSDRREGIGGSDASAILGVNPWKRPLDVWLEKTGRERKRPSTKAMEWGLLLEDVIAQRYMARTDRQVWNPDRLMSHPEHPILNGTPDRLVIGEERGLEIKTAGAWMEGDWGDEGTDQVPRHYVVQCAHYMAITGFEEWDLMVLIGGNDDRLFTIRRDPAFEAILVSRLTEWWDRHIVKGIQPPLDGSDSSTEYLATLYPTNTSDKRIGAPDDADVLGKELVAVKGTIKVWEAKEQALVNALKEQIGEFSGMDGNGWRATWTGGNEKYDTDWHAVALEYQRHLVPTVDAQAIVSGHTEPKLTPRRFLVKSNDNGKAAK